MKSYQKNKKRVWLLLAATVLAATCLPGRVEAKESRGPVEYVFPPDVDYGGAAVCEKFRLAAKNVDTVKVGRNGGANTVLITKRDKPQTLLELNPLKRLKKAKNGIWYQTYTVSNHAKEFYVPNDRSVFVKRQDDIYATSYNPHWFFPGENKPIINKKVISGITKCWSGEGLFAYIQDNTLYLRGREVFGYGEEEGYTDVTEMKFFEGRGEQVKQVVSGNLGGESSVFVLMKDGSVWGCGRNYKHTISKEKTGTIYRDFVRIIPGGVKKISATAANVSMIKKDNSLWVWGKSMNGKSSSVKPKKIADNVKECELVNMRTSHCDEKGEDKTAMIYLKKGVAYGMGCNETGMFTASRGKWVKKPVKLMSGIKHIDAVDLGRTLLLTKKNELYWAGEIELGRPLRTWMPKVKKKKNKK